MLSAAWTNDHSGYTSGCLVCWFFYLVGWAFCRLADWLVGQLVNSMGGWQLPTVDLLSYTAQWLYELKGWECWKGTTARWCQPQERHNVSPKRSEWDNEHAANSCSLPVKPSISTLSLAELTLIDKNIPATSLSNKYLKDSRSTFVPSTLLDVKPDINYVKRIVTSVTNSYRKNLIKSGLVKFNDGNGAITVLGER